MKKQINFLLYLLAVVLFRFIVFYLCYKISEDSFPDKSTFYAYGLYFLCICIPFWVLSAFVYTKWGEKHIDVVQLCSYVPEIAGVVLSLRILCLSLHMFYFFELLIYVCIPSILVAVVSYFSVRYILKKGLCSRKLMEP